MKTHLVNFFVVLEVLSYQNYACHTLFGRPRISDFDDDSQKLSQTETKYKIPENGELFEEDIIMNNHLRNAILNKKRTAIDGPLRWNEGIIIYKNNISNSEGLDLFNKAIKEFERRTCIRFKEWTGEPDYVVYTDHLDMCASAVGKDGGKQIINLGISCNVLGTFLHETMHALGFIHEHSRPDRDVHVNINWKNIDRGERMNFAKYKISDTVDTGTAYNFASVMHYRNDAFTNNGKDTIVAKNDPTLRFGQRKKFSVGDVHQINKLYNCNIKEEDIRGLYRTYDQKAIQNDNQVRHKKIIREFLLKDLYYEK